MISTVSLIFVPIIFFLIDMYIYILCYITYSLCCPIMFFLGYGVRPCSIGEITCYANYINTCTNFNMFQVINQENSALWNILQVSPHKQSKQ